MLKRLSACVLLSVPIAASATLVSSTFTSLGASHWSVDLVVTNDSSATPISEFTVYFPESNFSSLQLQSGPATWDPIVVQPDLGLPAPGFVDGLVLDAGDALDLGESIGVFQVTFDLVGVEEPFALPFEVYDSSFNLLDSGYTIPIVVAPTPVSEPATSWLVMMGTLLLTIRRHRRAMPRWRDALVHA